MFFIVNFVKNKILQKKFNKIKEFIQVFANNIVTNTIEKINKFGER